MDFTVKKYSQLLKALQSDDYSFFCFKDFLTTDSKKTIILRHDVDLLPQNSLCFAKNSPICLIFLRKVAPFYTIICKFTPKFGRDPVCQTILIS